MKVEGEKMSCFDATEAIYGPKTVSHMTKGGGEGGVP